MSHWPRQPAVARRTSERAEEPLSRPAEAAAVRAPKGMWGWIAAMSARSHARRPAPMREPTEAGGGQPHHRGYGRPEAAAMSLRPWAGSTGMSPPFVLLPGAGSGPDHWHLVVPLLRASGHRTVTPDLPCESDTAGLPEYTAAALDAIGERDDDVIVVGQSLGAFTAAAVAAARPTRLLVYVNAMIPARRGESPGGWWAAVGHEEAAAETLRRHGPMTSWSEADMDEVFLHDVPAAAAAGALPRDQGG